MRSTWTDARLVDLNGCISDLSARVHHQSNRIDSLQQAVIVVGGGLFAAFVAVLAAILGLIATQL